ncbi:FI21212p1 [Strongyloides ratti]|uniref:FI21212p1 n=1 Tax=Strongyloides ratti TaxID=34506 RepID=A0A090LII1_STRRB|nr:FI21212p1 [Strongyloides ratti]CEF67290.1 FI21212p1 [Strongyloides ratti]
MSPVLFVDEVINIWDPFFVFANEYSYQKAKLVLLDCFREWEYSINSMISFTDISPSSRQDILNMEKNANIDIFFAKFDHDDLEAFDGRNGIIAHSSKTSKNESFIHFDASERWATNSRIKNRLDLKLVALHEIGHILGLKHNSFHNSIMNPYYIYYKSPNEDIPPVIHFQDISDIQKLYMNIDKINDL